MKRLVKISLLAMFLFSVVNVSFAIDLEPAPYRGLPGSTVQGWEFESSDMYPLPDCGDNPNGQAQAMVHGGYWDLSPDGGAWYDTPIEFYVPNTDNTDPDSWKEIRIQVTLVNQIGFPIEPPFIDVFGSDGLPGMPVWEDFIMLAPDMAVYIQDWIIQPNPIEEYIFIDPVIFPGAGISEVVIDTICIPEPATMLLLGLGGLLLRKRK